MSADPAPTSTELTAADAAARILEAVSRAIVGVDEQLELLLVGLLARGHVLIEDVPGTGKTSAVRALARATGLDTSRIQCTPDLLPTELTGVNVFDQSSGSFSFRRGPVFTDLLLVDEINRATPRTQAALLEAMAERQVTVDGASHGLGERFTVVATQNPVEQGGTFPLPEAQLDRFLMRVTFGYPDREAQRAILRERRGNEPLESIECVVDATSLLPALWAQVAAVHVDESLEDLLLGLIEALRAHADVAVGPSVRAVLMVEEAVRALAAIAGRDYVLPDDLRRLAVPALAHRLVLNEEAAVHGRDPETLVAEVLDELPIPLEVTEPDGATRR
ncbi:MAG: AAA family ATPase [Nitriliruptoraceae bacterium]|nr:AAA family ATPase [Nitriliruptoraceae bacterium]